MDNIQYLPVPASTLYMYMILSKSSVEPAKKLCMHITCLPVEQDIFDIE